MHNNVESVWHLYELYTLCWLQIEPNASTSVAVETKSESSLNLSWKHSGNKDNPDIYDITRSNKEMDCTYMYNAFKQSSMSLAWTTVWPIPRQ